MHQEKAIAVMKANGVKVTPQRRGIISALQRADQPLSIKEIYKRVKKVFPDISHDTVYRTVDMLVRLQVLAPIHLTGRVTGKYELQDPEKPHHHLICIKCGRSFCLKNCPLDTAAVPEAEQLSFKIKGHALEFYGYCEGCSLLLKENSDGQE